MARKHSAGSHRRHGIARCLVGLLACLGLADQPRADDGLVLQGLFCNTEAQIDGALALFGRGRSLPVAAEIANVDEVACTYVDALHYLVADPVEIAERPGRFLLPKYRARLVGVIAGDQLRPVSPPAEVYFVTPGPLAETPVERRS
jgi:hypothetical protein